MMKQRDTLSSLKGSALNGQDNPPSDGKDDLPAEEEEQLLKAAVRRLNGNILGLVMGMVGGLLLFVATIWLVIKGGETVGPHLSLLGQYLIGYDVSLVGSFIGAAYGFVLGFGAGWLIAWVYNWVIDLKRG